MRLPMNDGSLRAALAVFLASAVGLTGCFSSGSGGGGGNNDNGNGNGDPAEIAELRVESADAVLPEGVTEQFTATAIHVDGSSSVVTDDTDWEVADEDIAEFGSDTPGLLTAKAVGETVVIGTYQDHTGNAALEVVSGEVLDFTLDPTAATLAIGEEVAFRAIAEYEGDVTRDVTLDADWVTGDEAVASVGGDDEAGRVRGEDTGETTVTVEFGDASATGDVTVTSAVLQGITISEVDDQTSVNQSALARFQAIADITGGDQSTKDVTEHVIWSTEPEDVLEIHNRPQDAGLAIGRLPGSVTVSAAMGDHEDELPFDVLDAPAEPASLTLMAEPNVILDDGQDTSSLRAVVEANDPENEVVADGREVLFEVVSGELTLADGQGETVGGEAVVTASGSTGSESMVRARVPGTIAEGEAGVRVVSSFEEAGVPVGVLGQNEALFLVYNLSNRPFVLEKLELRENDQVLDEITDVSDIKGGVLQGGGSITMSFEQLDQVNNPEDLVAVYFLRDEPTGQAFEIHVPIN